MIFYLIKKAEARVWNFISNLNWIIFEIFENMVGTVESQKTGLARIKDGDMSTTNCDNLTYNVQSTGYMIIIIINMSLRLRFQLNWILNRINASQIANWSALPGHWVQSSENQRLCCGLICSCCIKRTAGFNFNRSSVDDDYYDNIMITINVFTVKMN